MYILLFTASEIDYFFCPFFKCFSLQLKRLLGQFLNEPNSKHVISCLSFLQIVVYLLINLAVVSYEMDSCLCCSTLLGLTITFFLASRSPPDA